MNANTIRFALAVTSIAGCVAVAGCGGGCSRLPKSESQSSVAKTTETESDTIDDLARLTVLPPVPKSAAIYPTLAAHWAEIERRYAKENLSRPVVENDWGRIESPELKRSFPKLEFARIRWNEETLPNAGMAHRALMLGVTVAVDTQLKRLIKELSLHDDQQVIGELIVAQNIVVRDESDARQLWKASCVLRDRGRETAPLKRVSESHWKLGIEHVDPVLSDVSGKPTVVADTHWVQVKLDPQTGQVVSWQHVFIDYAQKRSMPIGIAPQVFAEPDPAAGSRAPFDDELHAEEFAIGVVGDIVERGAAQEKFLPLKLERVFLGRLPVRDFLANDAPVVRIECSMPPVDLGLRSQLYKSGMRVVIYFGRNKDGGWLVNSFVPIKPGEEKRWQDHLQLFADVFLADESPNPAEHFRKLLVLNRNGIFESEVYCALLTHPHPAARPVVRDLWRAEVKRVPVSPADDGHAHDDLALVRLMRGLGDGEMLDEVLDYALRQKSGLPGDYFSELRWMAESATAEARQRLKTRLQKFIDDSPPLESVDRVKDSKLWGDITTAKETIEHLKSR